MSTFSSIFIIIEEYINIDVLYNKVIYITPQNLVVLFEYT